jgi:hypothetical protein
MSLTFLVENYDLRYFGYSILQGPTSDELCDGIFEHARFFKAV